MAVVKQKESSLHKKRRILYGKAILGIASVIIALYLFIIQKFLIGLILMIGGGFLTYNQKKEIKIINYGIKGERLIYKKLKKLSKEYKIYNDIQLFYKGEGAQIDHLIVSPYGVFCIESKNLKGKIVGDGQSNNWVLKKTGRNGGQYEKEFYNPCKQSAGHARVVEGILKKSGIYRIRVYSIVVFNEENAQSIYVKNCSIPVIKGDKLLEQINFYSRKNKPLPKEIVTRMEDVLDKKKKY